MSDQKTRYDRIAEGYARWWAPVHRAATLALLDEIAPAIEAGARSVVDIGCGIGTLAGAIAGRWPQVRVTGTDISSGMLAIAERELARLPGEAQDRITICQGAADRLPLADGAADVATCAFVYQLVPSRFRALRDARRILRPGGTLAYVTWLAGGRFAADEVYDEALEAAGHEPECRAADHDEPEDPGVLVAQLRRAGFADVTAHVADVDHRFTPDGYLAFMAQFDDEDRWASLDAGARAALEADLLARLRALDPDGLRMRLPVAYVRGRRTARA